jgi:hypothetical protein
MTREDLIAFLSTEISQSYHGDCVIKLKDLLNEPSEQRRALQFEEDFELEMHYPMTGRVTGIDHSVPPYYEVTDTDGDKMWVNPDVLS